MVYWLQCSECGRRVEESPSTLLCPVCSRAQKAGMSLRGVLTTRFDQLPRTWPGEQPQGLERFLSAFLPFKEGPPPFEGRVGHTPLLPATRLAHALGMDHLWLKDDTRNPSGSTKDRASYLVVLKAMENRIQTIACASTGNAATALSACCASAGLRAVVFVPASAPVAKRVQIQSYGAQLLPVEGTYDDAFDLCLTACQHFGWYNRNTALNPFTIEGKKTAALEVAVQLGGRAPDAVFIPTGDGVILSGVAKGFEDLKQAGLISGVPRLIAVQPERSDALTQAFEDGHDDITPLQSADSVADSLNVTAPRNARMALRVLRASRGCALRVSEQEILMAQSNLARSTGIFAEPSASATLAGLKRALDSGCVTPDESIVLLITGHGLKDIDAASRMLSPSRPIAPTLEAVKARCRVQCPS